MMNVDRNSVVRHCSKIIHPSRLNKFKNINKNSEEKRKKNNNNNKLNTDNERLQMHQHYFQRKTLPSIFATNKHKTKPKLIKATRLSILHKI